MSNALSVPAVTAALTTLVRSAVDRLDLVPRAVVAPGPLDGSGENARVGVHLYRVSRNPACSVADLPTRSRAGDLRQQARAALDLHYLFTFRGNSEWEAQQLLARAAGALHAAPLLTRALLADAESEHPEIAGQDLADAEERVRFTPDVLSTDELTRLWALFPPGSFAPTLAVTAGPVLIDGGGEPGTVLPVRSVASGVRPAGPPRLDRVAGPDGAGAPVRSAAPMPDLHLYGHGLAARAGETLQVLLDGEPAERVTALDDTHLVVGSPPLAPGVRRLRVRRQVPASAPSSRSAPTGALVSEPVAVRVVPTLVEVAPATRATGEPGLRSGALTATVIPEVTAAQRVRLLLDRTGDGPLVTLSLSARLDPQGPPAGRVEFAAVDVPAGRYRVTLEVDGARGIPPVDDAGRYVLPVVTL